MWLKAGFELLVHKLYGYASFAEYVDRVFGFTARQTEERLRVAGVLESTPKLAGKLEQGELTFTVVRELSRVADADNEEEWLDSAEGKRSSEVQKMVSSRCRGDRPSDPKPLDSELRRVTLRLSARSHALFQEARQALIQESGGHVDDDALAERFAMAVLSNNDASDKADGTSAYQIALNRCEDCKQVRMSAGGAEVVVDEVEVEMAACDSQDLGVIDDGAMVPPRATQNIPPRVRRAVVRRHKNCCAVPGCKNGAFTHVHHTDPRAEGGTHDPDRLVLVCTAHHRAVHDRTLTIRSRASTGFVFEHADGSAYGSTRVDTQHAEVCASACEMLSGMGFKMREARAMVDAVRAVDCPPEGASRSLEYVVRNALLNTPFIGVRENAQVYRRAS
jgi:hypothetical protein